MSAFTRTAGICRRGVLTVPFWLFCFSVIERRLCPGIVSNTSSYVHRWVYRWVRDVIVIIYVYVATTSITLYATFSTAVHFCATGLLACAERSSDTVRTLPAVRRHQESSNAAAALMSTRLFDRRTVGHFGRRRRAAVWGARDAAAAVDSRAISAAARRRWTGCGRRCRRCNLDETLAEVPRIDDDTDSSVCCRIGTLVVDRTQQVDQWILCRAYMWNKSIFKIISAFVDGRRPSEITLFQRVETCPKLFRNYFRSLLQLMNIFQHVRSRWKNFEIILELLQRLK